MSEDEGRRLGGVLESHYRLMDQAIGRAIDELERDDLLLIVSAYGMEPLGLGKRVLERIIGDPELSGTHEAAPDGFPLETAEDFDWAAVAAGVQSLADDLSGALERKRAELEAQALEEARLTDAGVRGVPADQR